VAALGPRLVALSAFLSFCGRRGIVEKGKGHLKEVDRSTRVSCLLCAQLRRCIALICRAGILPPGSHSFRDTVPTTPVFLSIASLRGTTIDRLPVLLVATFAPQKPSCGPAFLTVSSNHNTRPGSRRASLICPSTSSLFRLPTPSLLPSF